MKSSLLKSKSITRKPKVTAGDYVARCENVKLDPDYIDPTFVFDYLLINKAGKEFKFTERFVEKAGFTRTLDFYDYLEKNGIEELEDFVGKYELIKIAWNFDSHGRRLPSITTRKFITAEEFDSRAVLGDA